MTPFLFVLSRGPEDPTRAGRTFFLAKMAAEKGHPVTVFLLDDGVYWTNLGLAERTRIPTGDELGALMGALRDKNVPILVCKPCADSRQVDEADLPPGFALSTAAKLLELAEQAKVFTF